MSVPLFPVIIILLLFIGGMYATYGKRNKIFCWFEGQDGTDEFKWVSSKDEHVIFRGYKFDIVTDRITNLWIHTGIHMLFPTRAACLKYTWYSRFPRNPRNYGRTIISPKVRKVIDKGELVESYFKSSQPNGINKKQGFLMQYLPLIAIAAIVILGFYVYNNDSSISKQLAIIQEQVKTVLPK